MPAWSPVAIQLNHHSRGLLFPATLQHSLKVFLQVASFRKHADADKARANLILLNMNANIEQSTLQSGTTAYRVIVGPYTSKSKLAKARDTLVSNGFEYLTLKRKIWNTFFQNSKPKNKLTLLNQLLEQS